MNNDDEPNDNKLFLIFPFLLVILLAVGYARLPAVRNLVDSKAPWFREKAGHYLLSVVPGAVPDSAPGGDQQGGPTGGGGDAPSGPAWATGPQGFDIAIFSAHPESWPKSVAIKAATEFPAVLNNKQVGTISVPAGSEVHLVKVENGKLGVEYQGGGKWVAPEATDLLQRIHANAAAHQ